MTDTETGSLFLTYKNLAEQNATIWFNKPSNWSSYSAGAYDGGSGSSVNYTISANPIVVPVPLSGINKYNIGFDINLVTSENIRLTTVFKDGFRTNSYFWILKDLRTTKELVHSNYTSKPYELTFGDHKIPVFLTNVSGNVESGQGNIVNCSITMEVATQT